MKNFVDQHRQTHGVESICKVLQIAPSGYWRHAAHQRNPHLRCARARRDDTLVQQVQRVWHANRCVYGANKVWKQMNREGLGVARCTVERLMQRLGLQGVRLDADILAFFKSKGAGYQSRTNAALRMEVERNLTGRPRTTTRKRAAA